jgi:hypothetical protein
MEKFSRLPDRISPRFLEDTESSLHPGGVGYSHARTALKFGLQSLFSNSGPSFVLVPEFICDVALHPFEQLGIEVEFYESDDALRPHWAGIESECETGKFDAILAIHYFGFPQEISRFLEIARKFDLHLIEDNAHGFGSGIDGRPLGTFGEIGIASPRKILPVFNGGILYSENASPAGLPHEPGKFKEDLISNVRRLVEKIPGAVRFLRKERPAYHDPAAFLEAPIPDWSIDKHSSCLLSRLNTAEIRSSRRKIYEVWESWSRSVDLESVFKELPAETSPLVFPAWAPDEKSRNSWLDWGYENRIDVHTWPTLPRRILESAHPNPSMEKWKKLVCFPVHQEMNAGRLAQVISNAPSPR